ncbi:MAG: Ig-like domain-containing protein [Flavisolibacter sp.]
MKKPTVLRIWPLLCAVLIFSACQKDASKSEQDVNPTQESTIRTSGVIPDDPASVAKVPLIVSSAFLKNQNNLSKALLLSSKGKPVKPGTDATPPSVSITSPVNGVAVSGTISIQVVASDNIGVASVNLTIDGVSIKTLTAAPYNFTWTVSTGTHTVTATAKDAAGNSSSNSISVSQNKVSADITAPSVSITSPANGATVSGTVSVTVSASDNTAVSAVSLSVDGTAIGTLTVSPYKFSWDASTTADGTHTLTASAKDAAGNSTASSILITKNTTITTLPPSTTLPASYSLVMPPVQNQGGEGICAPFATVYAARSAEQYYKTGAASYSYSTNIFSPEFVYDQIKTSDCGSGTGVTTSLDFLVNKGVCTWQSMPYSSSNGCSLLPTTLQTSEAANFKIASYSKIVTSDVTAMKTMVVNKHPVIITIATDQSFWNAQPGFIWKTYSAAPGISHTLVICGFDDARHAYKVMNSWGTTWGDAGYSWIDYDFLPQASFYYSYVIN